MRIPSVKSLAAITDKPKELRRVLENGNPASWSTWDEADELCCTSGSEHIPEGNNSKSPAITYLNTGDSYGTTLLYVNGSYRVGCWGDIVERGHYD